MPYASKFLALFAGLQRAYGVYHLSPAVAGKKRAGKGETVRGLVNAALWESHLKGEIQIGIVPVRDDGMCVFTAIDIDIYNLNHVELLERISQFKLPLLTVRSKSGGAHLYTFYKTPVEAELARELAAQWAATLGHAKVEIFPKQSRLASTDDTGNWINMPYSGGDSSDRHALWPDGTRMTMEEFLLEAQSKMVAPSIFQSTEESPELLEGAPPCLVTLANGGFGEGGRNSGLFSMGVFAKKKWPEEWEQKVLELHDAFMQPPLDSAEINQVIKHLAQKEYSYPCKNPPICNVCQRNTCVKRKFGVTWANHQEQFGLPIDSVIRVEGTPARYFANYAGKRVTFGSRDFVTQAQFRYVVAEYSNATMVQISRDRWDTEWAKILADAQVVPAPPEVSQEVQAFEALEEFCTANAHARDMEDVLDGMVYEKDGRIYLVPAKFVKAYNREFRRQKDVNDLYHMLREFGLASENVKIGNRTRRLWSFPAFARPEKNGDTL